MKHSYARLYLSKETMKSFKAMQALGSPHTTGSPSITVTLDFSQAKIRKNKKRNPGRPGKG